MKEENKEVVIDMFNITREVMEKVDVNTLSKQGVKTLEDALTFTLPTCKVVVCYSSESNKIARAVMVGVQKKLCLMSFKWYGEVYDLIVKAIDARFEGVQE